MRNLLKLIIYRVLYSIKLKLVKNKFEMNYSDNNIFITGANSGIGLGLTHKFLELNNRVFATYKDNCENLAKINNKNLILIKCNQKNLNEIEDIKSKINNIPINLIINNAGIWGPKEQSFKTLNFKTFQDIMMVNSLSVIKIAQVILDSTVKNSLKMIVNISSDGGSIERNNLGNFYMYRTSKTALNAITKNMAIDLLKSNNIVVFAIHPGEVKSKLNPGGALGADKCANLIVKLIVNKGKDLNGKFVDLLNNEIPW